ncbi:ER-associated protein degradation protein [Aphanomyces cochlioides]|nr:ER-associated protein degradation protein [Aphanomyces cochlioides]
MTQFGLLSPRTIYLDFELVFFKFNFWRLITCFCFVGKFSFHFLVCLLLLGQYGTVLEKDPFVAGGGPTADFAFMLIIGGSVLAVIGFFLGYPFLGEPMIFMILYVWSRKHPEQMVSFWGFQFKALYFPWAMVGFTLLTGGDPIPELAGVFAGHVFYFFLEILPNTKDIHLLKTPQFLVNLFPSNRPIVPPRQAAPGAAATGPSSYNWGTGRTLGRD